MKDLCNELNTTTNSRVAPSYAESISYEQWSEEETFDLIIKGFEELGVDKTSGDNWEMAIDLVSTALSAAYPEETIYFWFD